MDLLFMYIQSIGPARKGWVGKKVREGWMVLHPWESTFTGTERSLNMLSAPSMLSRSVSPISPNLKEECSMQHSYADGIFQE